MKKLNIFDILKNITETNTDLWYQFQNIYKPFIINRYLSMDKNTLPFASMMNKADFTPKEQYHFYLHAIPNKRRFLKYLKQDKFAKLEVVCNYYNVSKRVGKEYLKVLTKENIKEIEKSFDIGGVVK